MNYQISRLVLLCAPWLFTACVNSSTDSTYRKNQLCSSVDESGDQAPGIFGGTKASKESWLGRGVISIITTADNEDKSICSGTLIDQNIILTAAHCVDKLERAWRSQVIFSADPLCSAALNGGLDHVGAKVDAVIIHQGYGNSKNGEIADDLAMIRLASPAPFGFVPVRLASYEIPMSRASTVLLAGYGTSADYNNTEGDRHDLKFTKVHPYEGPTSQKNLRQMQSSNILYFDQRLGTGACAGDSGGPAFIKDRNGEYRQIGVASKVDSLEDSGFSRQSDVTCRKGIAHTSVLMYRPWIETSFSYLRNWDSRRSHAFDP